MPLLLPSSNYQRGGNYRGATSIASTIIEGLFGGKFLVFLLVLLVSNRSALQAFPIGDLGRRQITTNTDYASVRIRSKMNRSPVLLFCTSKTTATTTTFREYLDDQIRNGHIHEDLVEVLLGVAKSCAEVSRRLTTHTLDHSNESVVTTVNVQGEQQKGMDVVANDIFIQTLKSVDSVSAIASEEEETVIYTANNINSNDTSGKDPRHFYEIAFDPLDGSGNLDVNLPTGSIFGVAEMTTEENVFSRPGSDLVAAGYALYSSSTELVISLGKNQPVVGFTLLGADNDDESFGFVLSRMNIRCPTHGPYYSLNEAREPDWPNGLRQWIHDAKRGQTSTGKTYSSRYVCSLCADFHRTLLQGGWAGNPRPHLRLLYEAAPLAFLIESAGGKGSDGTQNLLEIIPEGLHDRICVFLGSKDDIDDLESYGDVQQIQAKRYEA